MRKQYHILNGDSLKEQFPECIQGEIIIARECFVDGTVKGNSLNDLFKTRARFISKHYDGFTEEDYFEKTVPEFQKMQNISDNADINLWFEDDLFCQVNLWFVLHLLSKSNLNNHYFLIRPDSLSQYGFGGLDKSKLKSIYESRLKLSKLDKLAKLWEYYQTDDLQKLSESAEQLKDLYPFILEAVEAHIERIPGKDDPGRPSRSLIKIMADINTIDFAPIFKEFCKRETIYGFGDIQVKRLIDAIKKES